MEVSEQSYPATAAAPPERGRSRAGWWVAGIFGVLLLGFFALCAIVSIAALGGDQVPVGAGAVAVIHIDQAIAGTGSSSANPEEIIRQLKKAEKDGRVKAILLRIDSPGGTASASQEIAMEVARQKKPVVASIGDLGASGAYMIASQTDHIVASPSSGVGSIGVIQQFPNFEGLMGKVGVKLKVIHSGKFKDAGSPFRELTATETAMFEQQMTLVYDEFIKQVATGRRLDEAKVRELATGWLWTGREAKGLGLVDSLGNYSDGLKEAARRGGIKGEPAVITYETPGLPGLLGALFGASSPLSPLGSAVSAQSPYTPPLAR